MVSGILGVYTTTSAHQSLSGFRACGLLGLRMLMSREISIPKLWLQLREFAKPLLERDGTCRSPVV